MTGKGGSRPFGGYTRGTASLYGSGSCFETSPRSMTVRTTVVVVDWTVRGLVLCLFPLTFAGSLNVLEDSGDVFWYGKGKTSVFALQGQGFWGMS